MSGTSRASQRSVHSLHLSVINLADDSDNSRLNGSGLVGTLLVGHDWPMRPNWALGLELVASRSAQSGLNCQKSGNDSGYDLAPFSIGLSASILYF